MALPTYYNLLDTARGDFVLNKLALEAILDDPSTPGFINVPGTTSGKYFKWNVTDSLMDVRGEMKLISRPTADPFVAQIKSEYSGTNAEHFGVQTTVDWKANGVTGGGARANYGLARLDSTFSLAGAANLIGAEDLIQVDGTISGTGLHAGNYSAILAGAGTLTAVGHIAARWADTQLAAAPSSGLYSLDYLTNNGTGQLGQVWYIYGGDKTTNLMALDTVAGMVSTTTTGVPGGTIQKIQILIGGVPYFLIASTIPG